LLFEKKTKFEYFNISENNIISEEYAKVVLVGYCKLENRTPNTQYMTISMTGITQKCASAISCMHVILVSVLIYAIWCSLVIWHLAFLGSEHALFPMHVILKIPKCPTWDWIYPKMSNNVQLGFVEIGSIFIMLCLCHIVWWFLIQSDSLHNISLYLEESWISWGSASHLKWWVIVWHSHTNLKSMHANTTEKVINKKGTKENNRSSYWIQIKIHFYKRQ